jgi:hypothetical protein
MTNPDNLGQTFPFSKKQERGPISFVKVIEFALQFRDEHQELICRAKDLLQTIGAEPIGELPLQTIPPVIARLPTALNHSIYFVVVDPRREFVRFIHHEHDLHAILDLHPKHPDFWQQNSHDGIVAEDYYHQELDEDEVHDFPNGYITLGEDSFLIQFSEISERTLISPLNTTTGICRFDTLPPLLSRAWQVDKNAYNAQRKSKRRPKRILGVKFDLSNPRHGRPVNNF